MEKRAIDWAFWDLLIWRSKLIYKWGWNPWKYHPDEWQVREIVRFLLNQKRMEQEGLHLLADDHEKRQAKSFDRNQSEYGWDDRRHLDLKRNRLGQWLHPSNPVEHPPSMPKASRPAVQGLGSREITWRGRAKWWHHQIAFNRLFGRPFNPGVFSYDEGAQRPHGRELKAQGTSQQWYQWSVSKGPESD